MTRSTIRRFGFVAPVACLALAVQSEVAFASDTVSTWDGSFLESWSEPTRWTPEGVPNNGAETFDAVITQGNVILDLSGGATINNLTLANAFLSGAEPLLVSGDPGDPLAHSSWVANLNSEIRNTAGVQIGAAAVLDLSGNGPKNLGAPGSVDIASLTVDGTVNQFDLGALNAIGGGAAVQINETGNWSLEGDADFGSVGPAGSLTNAGLLSKASGLAISRFNSRWSVVNSGTVRVDSGTLEFQGSFEHTGTAEVNGGVLALDGDVSGDGGFTGTGEVQFDGDYAPGDGAASIGFGGDVTLGANADLTFEIAAIDSFDNLDVTGALQLGGDLIFEVLPAEGMEAEAYEPTLGDAFVIASADGGVTGVFSNVTAPPAAEGFEWNLEVSATEVTLRYAVAPLAGDFNSDGVVDAADYTVWRDEILNTSAYNTWRDNYGAVAPAAPPAATGVSVPEPATGVLLLVCLAASRRRA